MGLQRKSVLETGPFSSAPTSRRGWEPEGCEQGPQPALPQRSSSLPPVRSVPAHFEGSPKPLTPFRYSPGEAGSALRQVGKALVTPSPLDTEHGLNTGVEGPGVGPGAATGSV